MTSPTTYTPPRSRRHNRWLAYLALTLCALALVGCHDNYQPKPRGYFRIQMPPHHYKSYTPSHFPYSMSLPANCHVVKATQSDKKYWITIIYPYFKAQLYLSYKPIHHNLATMLNDNHKLMSKHIPKANAISEQMYSLPADKVHGMTYTITGPEVASPFQFYLTDSTQHFVRGALYFNFTPNNDSLAPVIQYIEQDIKHMIETFRWTH